MIASRQNAIWSVYSGVGQLILNSFQVESRPRLILVIPEELPSRMYFKDAVRALDMLYQAPMEQIRTINYNVSGLKRSVTAKEIEEVIKKHIPEFSVSYNREKEVVEYLKKYKDGMQILDDTRAREEWGWEPRYNNLDGMIVDFIEEVRRGAELFGIIG